MCVGRYTKPQYVIRGGKRVRDTQTQQFLVGDVGFFKDVDMVPRSLPVKLLLTSDSTTLKNIHYKNNWMGETIHQKATGTYMFPVKALAHMVHTILQNGGTTDTLLCAYKCRDTWWHVQSADIIVVVCTSTKHLKLQQKGIYPDLVGYHSLRAGGNMVLKLHDYEDTTIKKIGTWNILTFLQYI